MVDEPKNYANFLGKSLRIPRRDGKTDVHDPCLSFARDAGCSVEEMLLPRLVVQRVWWDDPREQRAVRSFAKPDHPAQDRKALILLIVLPTADDVPIHSDRPAFVWMTAQLKLTTRRETRQQNPPFTFQFVEHSRNTISRGTTATTEKIQKNAEMLLPRHGGCF
jgi:hypothetical protein